MTSKKVLVVDDEEPITEMMSAFLQLWGHQAETASNADQALALCKSTDFDVVITDFSMPGMNGLHLACAIFEMLHKQPKIILHTASNDAAGEGEKSKYIARVLRKPATTDFLRRAVEE